MKLQYVGKITELQGKTATVRPGGSRYAGFNYRVVEAQFDDDITFNGMRMDRTWNPFPAADFQPITEKPIF